MYILSWGGKEVLNIGAQGIYMHNQRTLSLLQMYHHQQNGGIIYFVVDDTLMLMLNWTYNFNSGAKLQLFWVRNRWEVRYSLSILKRQIEWKYL